MKQHKCVIDDFVNEVTPKFRACDGVVVGSPVYFASANGTLISFLDRLFAGSAFYDLSMKVGASVVSAITAAAHRDEIKGAILLYPAFCLVDMTKERFERVEDIPDTYFSLWMTIGRTYTENLLDYDIYEVIPGYDKDVLIIHGDADDIVPLSYSERALEVYQSSELKVIPGAGHGFYVEDAELAIKYMIDYLNQKRITQK